MSIWMIDTGLKVKSFSKIHGDAEVTCLAQDLSETRLYTGSADGTIKVSALIVKVIGMIFKVLRDSIHKVICITFKVGSFQDHLYHLQGQSNHC